MLFRSPVRNARLPSVSNLKQKLAFLGFSPSLRSILVAHNGSALRCFRTLKTEQCDLLASCLHSFLLSCFACSRRSHSLRLASQTEILQFLGLQSSLRSMLTAHDGSALLCRSSPRLISIGQLHASQRFHLRPINDIVYVEPYSFRMRDLILGGVSRLDAFSVYLVQT